MKTNYIYYSISILLIITSCDYQNKKTKATATDIDEDFYSKIQVIDEIKLPTTYVCGVASYKLPSEYGEAIEEITPFDYGIIGRLPSKLGYEFIVFGKIGDIIYPYLYQYDKSGNIIDSLYLYIGYCSGDDEVINTTLSKINQDLSINMIDTMKYIHFLTSKKYNIDSIIVRKQQLAFSNQGRFEVIQEK